MPDTKYMQVVTPQMVSGKKVLLRMDIDVPLENGHIMDDFRLEVGTPTLELCLEYAESVIVMGHIGRPDGKEVAELSVKPIVEWFEKRYSHINLPDEVFHVMENLRFESGEDIDPVSAHGTADEQVVLDFAKELASHGNFFINEAFASHHPSASTTVLPTLMPHAAGLNFAEEVDEILKIRNNPKKPLVAIIGGVKVEDKLPAVLALSKIADRVLVGGKIAEILKTQELDGTIEFLPHNVHLARLSASKEDISDDTVREWEMLLRGAKTIFWNGPLGKVEDSKNGNTRKIADSVLRTDAYTLVGGGDTVAALAKWGLMHHFDFVSSGGGAMLELLVKGTLPTIEALDS